MPKDLYVAGAYGRQYMAPEAAQKDWNDGKDFQITGIGKDHGRYCSVRDFDAIAKEYDAVSICLHAHPFILRIKLS